MARHLMQDPICPLCDKPMKDVSSSPIFPSEWECQTPDCKRNPNRVPPVQAFLIDPFAKTITPVDYDGDWQTISPMIDADLFDVVRFSPTGDVVFVDENGLFVDGQQFFVIEGYPSILAGKGLVLGPEVNEVTTAATIALPTLEKMVKFLTMQEAYQFVIDNDL